MILKTKSGKVVKIVCKDENGFCLCDDGWKRPESDFAEPTKEEVAAKRQELQSQSKPR